MAGKWRNYKPKNNKRRNKRYIKKYNKARGKTYQVNSLDKSAYRWQKIGYPLMPKTRLAKLNYVTRFQIDPLDVKAGGTETANNMAIHTLNVNSLYDIDYTATNVTGASRDGAPNHQPRMYDQWGLFYDYMTVLSAKTKICFTTKDKSVMTNTLDANGSTNGAIPVHKNPEPCFIGHLIGGEYDTQTSPGVRLDDVLEKKELRYHKTNNRPASYYLTHYWSLKKDPLYKTELVQREAGGSDVDWGAEYAHNVGVHNRRYLHIVAHPVTVENDENPLPIDVFVEVSQIVLMSGLKDIPQSN